MQQTIKNIFFVFLSTSIVKWGLVCTIGNASAYSYNYRNVSQWRNICRENVGKMQSPINIDPGKVEIVKKDYRLRFEGYKSLPTKITLKDNGHTVKLSGDWSNSTPFVSINPEIYVFDSLHFHWGTNNDEGSEHTFMNTSFPLEMHMVHKKKYESEEKIKKYSDGCLVIGMVFEISKTKESNISPLAKRLFSVRNKNDTTKIKPFKLSNFDFHPRNGYFLYNGSLTTPPCTENIIWLLSACVLTVTQDEMELFRTVNLDYGDKLNYRPTQALNGRKICYIPQY